MSDKPPSSIDSQLAEQTEKELCVCDKAAARTVRELGQQAEEDDAQLAADLEFLEKTSGQGDSNGWKWNRDEIYDR